MSETAKKIIIEVLSNMPQKKFELIADSTFRLEGKEVSNNTVISLSGFKLKVCYTEPKGTVLITPETIIELRKEVKASDIILAVDRSYSMKNTDYQPSRFLSAVNAIKFFLEKKINSFDRIAVLTFAYDTTPILPLTNITQENLEETIKKLGETKLGGRTSLANAISSSIEIFRESPMAGRTKSIIILTDGVDNIGENPLDMVKFACEKGAIINTILIGQQKDDATLRKISESTNGNFYFKATEEELNVFYKNFAEQMKSAKIVEDVCEIKEIVIKKDEKISKEKIEEKKEEVKKKRQKKEKKKRKLK